MYPADGVQPKGRIVCEWELMNCPWYLEYPDWNVYCHTDEEHAAEVLKTGSVPYDSYDIEKLPLLEESIQAAKELEQRLPAGDPEYDGKKARKVLSVQKVDSGDQSDEKSVEKSAEVTSTCAGTPSKPKTGISMLLLPLN